MVRNDDKTNKGEESKKASMTCYQYAQERELLKPSSIIKCYTS